VCGALSGRWIFYARNQSQTASSMPAGVKMPRKLTEIEPVWWIGFGAVSTALAWVLVHLGDRSLWFDELWTMGIASPGTPGWEAFANIKGDVHPPLYYFGVRSWLALFNSSSEWAARSFNLIGLAAALAGAAWAYKQRAAAPLAMWFTLFFTSFGLLWYLQEARMYAFLICHSFLTCAFALVYEQIRNRRLTPSFVFCTIGIFTVLPFMHWFAGLFSGLVLFGLFLFAAAERRKHYALLFLGAGVAFAALAGAWTIFDWKNTFGLMGSYGGGAARGWVLWQLRGNFTSTLLFAFTYNPLILFAAVLGVASLVLERPRRFVPLLLLTCSAVAVVLILAVSLTTPMYQSRNFTWFVAPGTLFASYGLSRLAAWLHLDSRQTAGALTLILIINLGVGHYADAIATLERDQWREAGQYLRNQPECASARTPVVMQWLPRAKADFLPEVQLSRRLYAYYGGGVDSLVPIYREDTTLPALPQSKCPILLWIAQMTEEDARNRGTQLLGSAAATAKIVRFTGHSFFIRDSGSHEDAGTAQHAGEHAAARL
jgi:hypothetical protein